MTGSGGREFADIEDFLIFLVLKKNNIGVFLKRMIRRVFLKRGYMMKFINTNIE